jgi:putative solute:sodium symporter small subunit
MDHDDSPAAQQRRQAILAARARHWARLRRLTVALLAVWFLTVFLTVWFARELAQVTIFGWPLSFYFAAQGAALVHLAIIGGYALRARRLDREAREELA